MDELSNVINRAEAFDAEQQQAGEYAPQESGPSGANPASEDAAENMAESVLRIGEAAAKMVVDRRVYVDDAEVEACRSSLAPFIQKYNLAKGDGKAPYQEEIQAGFYLGGLWKRFRRNVAQLRANDRAKAKANQEQNSNHGDQRKYQSQEPAHPVSGEVGIRKESDADTPGWDSENWGPCDPVGQQPRP